MGVVLRRVWFLTRLTVTGPGAWIGFFLFGTVLAIELIEVWINVQMLAWYKRFYDAVQQLDAATALIEIGVFAVIVAALSTLSLTSQYLRRRLLLRWRANLTDRTLDAWTQGKAYWHLRPGMSAKSIDNPDQRVSEDCHDFVRLVMGEVLDIITRSVALVSYLIILWNLSDFVLTLPIMGYTLDIPRYMVWVAIIYVLVSSVITHMIGKPFKNLYFQQEKREADFRHSLVQLRDNATEIAHSSGEAAERRRLDQRFDGIRENWYRLIRRELYLNLFTRPYYYSLRRMPLFFALPAFFAGSVTLGGLMQMSRTFTSVVFQLSWFIFSYRQLADLVAVSQRLEELFRMTDDPEPVEGGIQAINQGPSGDGALHVSGLHLSTPAGTWLAPVPDRVIAPGERVWVRGNSGQGKSTLLAAISGLWRYGKGEIKSPDDIRLVTLPQKPHLFSEGLAAAACYPGDPADVPRERLEEVLRKLGLGHRLGALDDDGEAALQGLSMGERQRLALARVLLHKPDWVILDEATSALDATAEAGVLALLRAELPEATIICVSHREPYPMAPFSTWEIGEAESEKAIA